MNDDYDRGDWEHEVKRDKALDRIAELEAENEKMATLLQSMAQLINAGATLSAASPDDPVVLTADVRSGLLIDYTKPEIVALRAQVAALEKDNDDIHELAEHYRVENKRLREALQLAVGPVLLGALDRDQIIADYGMLGWENYSRARAALEQP